MGFTRPALPPIPFTCERACSTNSNCCATRCNPPQKKAQSLLRDIAALGWPEASEKLVELAENAKALRQKRQVYTFSMLAAEADPNSAPALRLLLECPLFDFMKLSVLVRLARLAPDDAAVAAQIVELRTKYGLTSGG